MIEKRIAENVLAAALETGGDYSELYMEDTEQNNVSMVDGKVENALYMRRSGAGVRVLSGGKSAYAYSADTSEAALMAAARAAAAALSGVKEHAPAAFSVTRNCAEAPEKPYSLVDNAARIALLRDGVKAARAYSPEITQVTAGYLDVDQRVLIATSDGVWAEDRRPRGRVNFNAVAMKDGEAQTGAINPGRGEGFEQFRNLDMTALGSEAAHMAVTMLHAPDCPAGFVPVVIDGGFGGVILHEACVHSLEATSVARGNSEFCGKLGQKIASDIVTAVDDGTMPGEWGSIRVDDEGTPSQRNVLIENGVLKNYMIDKLGSRRMNMAPTGSGRRQSYAWAPTSRMRNTFIAPGHDDEAEMIATMGDGLYAKKMGGGSVNPATGEFNFAVNEGYLVKDGKIVHPVRGASLIGRGSQVLTRIDRVGHDMQQAQGMCGSMSGSVPTNVGQPMIRVTAMTVGGR